jgi:hypothetical protein
MGLTMTMSTKATNKTMSTHKQKDLNERGKDMGLFTQNMKPCIFRNGNEGILNHIMGNNPFSTIGTTKKVGICRIDKGCIIANHALFHFTFHLFLVECESGISHIAPKWNVPQISSNFFFF